MQALIYIYVLMYIFLNKVDEFLKTLAFSLSIN